jgi:hypothetical protein
MFGASYMGYTQWAAANEQHVALKTIIPWVTFCHPYQFIYSGGALCLGPSVSWGLAASASMAILRAQVSDAERQQYMLRLTAAMDGMTPRDTFKTLPLDTIPLIGRSEIAPYFCDMLDHPVYDAYWQKLDCKPEAIRSSVFHIASWYDLFLANSLQDYIAIREKGVSPAQKLLIGPWTHANIESGVGEVDFGLQASWMMVLLEEEQLAWYDYWLKGIQNGQAERPPVRIFVMGANRWRDEAEWPLQRAHITALYLHSGGGANTLDGDGTLNFDAPGEELPDHYVYDPLHPVPTRGGGLCCWQAALPAGAFDQRSIEQRPDVLVYTSTPLVDHLEVTGPLRVVLYVASSAIDTDFTAKLVDVSPDGFARNLQDGIQRAGLRPEGQIQNLVPGEPCKVEIDLAATSNLFLAGHRIRLEVSSSNFPRFARNPNTGQERNTAVDLQSASQTIFHDWNRPSHILLPLILDQ